MLRAEKISAAAELKVAGGNPKPRAWLVVLAYGAQALSRAFDEICVAVQQKPCVGPARKPSNPSSQLVKLGQTEFVCTLYYYRIAVWNIQP